MSVTLTVVLVATMAFGVSFVTRRASDAAAARATPMLLLGVLVGPKVLGIANQAVIEALQPELSVMLGVIGFHIGLSLDRRFGVARWSPRAVAFAVFVAIGVCAPAWVAFDRLFSADSEVGVLWLALALGAMAIVPSERIIAIGCGECGKKQPLGELLRSFSAVSGVCAIAVCGTALALSRASDSASAMGLSETAWLALTAVLGGACGVLYGLFRGQADDEERRFVAIVGTLLFATGLAVALGTTPLFVTLLAGLSVALVTPDPEVLHDELERIERPVEVGVLVMAGAMWTPPQSLAGWAIPAVYLVVRGLAIVAGASIATRGIPLRAHRVGLGLLSQGAISVAIAVSVAQVHPEAGPAVLTTALAAILLSDMAAARLLHRVLADAGEIRHSLEPMAEGPDPEASGEAEPT